MSEVAFAPAVEHTLVVSPAATELPARLAVTVETTHCLDEISPLWGRLAAGGVESPGQDLGFIRLWIEAHAIPVADQLYVTVLLDGAPIALLALWRRRHIGLRVYSWFPGSHVGCGAPLVDAARLAALPAMARKQLWRQMLAGLPGADVLHLTAVPAPASGEVDLFDGLGTAMTVETLYRASFASWEAANTTQRTKSRRKHDRQQGERLEALGQVSFEVIGNGPEAAPVLEEMFRQRARRFAVMGIADPFTAPAIARFYRATVEAGSGVDVKLHVLRLNGAIVAVRYNIVSGDRLFCLISSMSDDPGIQAGSPGKQCLLRVMQTVFDEGFVTFDMGAGFTDEKRHWCNEKIALATHDWPLTWRGRLAVAAGRAWQRGRAAIKTNPRLLALAKGFRARLHHGSATAAPCAPAEEAE